MIHVARAACASVLTWTLGLTPFHSWSQHSALPQGGHAYNRRLSSSSSGPPSSESSTPWRDLFLPLPQTVLTGMALFPSAPVPVQLLQLISGLPHPEPEVTSEWPLSAARTVKCAGQVLSPTMMSRGRSSEREEETGGVR